MNSKQRLYKVSRGEKADRVPFLPTILEYSAGFIGKTPSDAAVDAGLLEAAHIAAYTALKHDAITVGIDIYNIEAEALGCKVRFHDDHSIPGIESHPFADSYDPEDITFSRNNGRIKNILQAASGIVKRIGQNVSVGVAVCGPFSVAIELRGYENMISDCISGESRAKDILSAVLEFQKCYCTEIIKTGAGIAVFESWATPPLVSPGIYTEYVAPYEKELIGFLKKSGLNAVPLIIGGDTSAILDDMLETGTTLLVADFNSDIGRYVRKASDKKILLRGNIDPKLVEKGPVEGIIKSVDRMLSMAGGYERFVLGTGVIPFGTPIQNIKAIADHLEK